MRARSLFCQLLLALNPQADCYVFPTVENLWKSPHLLDPEYLHCFVMHISTKILIVLEHPWSFHT